MPLAESRLTAQSQISVPLKVRRKLGVGPGSTIEWKEDGDNIVVRRKGRYTFADIHKAIFGDHPPEPKSLEELKEGIHSYIRKRHGRR